MVSSPGSAAAPVPAGRYRVYGDIVHESGYAQTFVTWAEIPAAAGAEDSPARDPDDSWITGDGPPATTGEIYRFADGSTLTWARTTQSHVAGQEGLLTFVARDATGAPLTLEPYMGMTAHAAVTTGDGSVFAHRHPSGSVSMAALMKFGSDANPHLAHETMARGLSIPYAFPKPGPYRIWVQIKCRGNVLTAAFDAEVGSATISRRSPAQSGS